MQGIHGQEYLPFSFNTLNYVPIKHFPYDVGHAAQLPVDFYSEDTFILSNDDSFLYIFRVQDKLIFPDSGLQLMLSANCGKLTCLVLKEH